MKYKNRLSAQVGKGSALTFYADGKAAVSFNKVLSCHERALPNTACDLLFEHYPVYLLCAGLESHVCRKRTSCSMASEQENPRAYAICIDESYNGAIAQVCRSVHCRGWPAFRKLEALKTHHAYYNIWGHNRTHLPCIISFPWAKFMTV